MALFRNGVVREIMDSNQAVLWVAHSIGFDEAGVCVQVLVLQKIELRGKLLWFAIISANVSCVSCLLITRLSLYRTYPPLRLVDLSRHAMCHHPLMLTNPSSKDPSYNRWYPLREVCDLRPIRFYEADVFSVIYVVGCPPQNASYKRENAIYYICPQLWFISPGVCRKARYSAGVSHPITNPPNATQARGSCCSLCL